MEKDIIIAPITPSGISAIAVIRVSGEGSIDMVKKIFKGCDLSKKKSHTISFGDIFINKKIIDEVLISIFLGEKSFTKEDSVEISCHGSPYIVEKILQALLSLGARIAEPGEFSKRAFLNGRFSITQTEAIADLIHADCETSHNLALSHLKGGFENDLKIFRKKIIEYASLLELELDFSAENEIFVDRKEFKNLIFDLQKNIKSLISSFSTGKMMKNGIATAIIGEPNVGKSSLLNSLIKEERAIISSIAGTTRDVLQEYIFLNGVKFRLIDTAGIREKTSDEIEKIGIKKTFEQIERADIILVVTDLSLSEISELKSIKEKYASYGDKVILCGNKSDLVDEKICNEAVELGFLITSSISKNGIDELENKLINFSAKLNTPNSTISNIRHYDCLTKSNESIIKLIEMINADLYTELIMQEVKNLLNAIGEITGEVSTEDLLDNIFSNFCIGK